LLRQFFMEIDMWKLCKAGWEYHKALIITLYCLFLMLFVLNAVTAGGVEALLTKLMIFSLGALGIAGTEELKYKFNRMEALLPVPVVKIAVNKFFFIMSYWLILILLLLFSHAIRRGGVLELKFLWHTIALTGTILFAVSWINLNHDIGFYFYKKTTTFMLRLGAVSMVLLSALVGILMTEYGGGEGDNVFARFSFSPIGAWSVFLAGMLLSLWSMVIYKNRKSFVE
jgi:hypothetical protein